MDESGAETGLRMILVGGALKLLNRQSRVNERAKAISSPIDPNLCMSDLGQSKAQHDTSNVIAGAAAPQRLARAYPSPS